LQTTRVWDGTALQPLSNDTEIIPWCIDGEYAYIGGLRMLEGNFTISGVFPAKRVSGTSSQMTGEYTFDVDAWNGISSHYSRTINQNGTMGQILTQGGLINAANTWNGTWVSADANSITVTKDGDVEPKRKWFLVASDYLVIIYLDTGLAGFTNPTEMAFRKQQ
jgi:hypothetical protein